ncbi:hypothetical protein VIGAN_05033700 [Vigna angularis var. angularis]|uniref:RNase H type-1 domain-containing protein n=1 Tax=Vigna angularis var. angularis TaxID=157739 RepID=A0A0S3S2F0_PHAAN|nr:hypothetical protein VIGAN_05033700 [Vigna angularis var. angularis]
MLGLINIFRCQKPVQSPVCGLIRYFHKEIIPVEWKKPSIGWTKLNFDGSCKSLTGKASIGGLVRNHNAEFLLGYAESIGEANSTVAELTALRRGLELARENGWNDLWLEGDAKTLLEIIEKGKKARCMEVERHISDIKSILPDFNKMMVSHIYREGNGAAHKFAQIGHDLDHPTIWRLIPPDELVTQLLQDAQGTIVLRMKEMKDKSY